MLYKLPAKTANYFHIFVTVNCPPATATQKMGSTGIDRMEISR